MLCYCFTNRHQLVMRSWLMEGAYLTIMEVSEMSFMHTCMTKQNFPYSVKHEFTVKSSMHKNVPVMYHEQICVTMG